MMIAIVLLRSAPHQAEGLAYYFVSGTKSPQGLIGCPRKLGGGPETGPVDGATAVRIASNSVRRAIFSAVQPAVWKERSTGQPESCSKVIIPHQPTREWIPARELLSAQAVFAWFPSVITTLDLLARGRTFDARSPSGLLGPSAASYALFPALDTCRLFRRPWLQTLPSTLTAPPRLVISPLNCSGEAVSSIPRSSCDQS